MLVHFTIKPSRTEHATLDTKAGVFVATYRSLKKGFIEENDIE